MLRQHRSRSVAVHTGRENSGRPVHWIARPAAQGRIRRVWKARANPGRHAPRRPGQSDLGKHLPRQARSVRRKHAHTPLYKRQTAHSKALARGSATGPVRWELPAAPVYPLRRRFPDRLHRAGGGSAGSQAASSSIFNGKTEIGTFSGKNLGHPRPH